MKHTIFTPVYNRAGNMVELAQHIQDIDYPKSDFEWLIIDDGSTDNLSETIDIIKEKFPELNMRCIHKKNGGIHTAQNCAIVNAKGEYVTRIDSDDYLLTDNLKKKDAALESIPVDMRSKVAGVVGLCLNAKDKTVRGTKFPQDYQITKGYLLKREGVSGDKNFCMRTEVMRQFLIPEYPDTKWVPEGGMLWTELDKNYDTLYVNEPMAVCAEPNEGSYSGNLREPSLANVMSAYYSAAYLVNRAKRIYGLKATLKSYIAIPYCLHRAFVLSGGVKTAYKLRRINTDIISTADRVIIYLLSPFALILNRLRNSRH